MIALPELFMLTKKKNKRIGIYSGSFNPPHEGHLLVIEQTLNALTLDCLLILVSPRNPLKQYKNLLSSKKRCLLLQKLIGKKDKVYISDLEKKLNIKYSIETIEYIKKLAPNSELFFICGTDIISTFHTWYRWQDILSLTAIAFYNRPGTNKCFEKTVLAQQYGEYFSTIPPPLCSTNKLPKWFIIKGPMSDLASRKLT